jgi:hypothetical protein
MEAIPFWTDPLEPMTAEAIALCCDADGRDTLAQNTLLIRLHNSV